MEGVGYEQEGRKRRPTRLHAIHRDPDMRRGGSMGCGGGGDNRKEACHQALFWASLCHSSGLWMTQSELSSEQANRNRLREGGKKCVCDGKRVSERESLSTLFGDIE